MRCTLYSGLPRCWAFQRLYLILATGVFFVSLVVGLLISLKGPIAELMTNQLLLEFVAGECVGLWFIKSGRLNQKLAVALLGAALAVYAEHILRGSVTGNRFLDRGVPAVALAFSLLAMERKIPFPQWLKSLGDSSYSLYLTHTFFVTAVYKLLASLGFVTSLPADIVVVLAVGIAVVGAHAVYRIFERPVTLFLVRSWERQLNRYGGDIIGLSRGQRTHSS